MPIRNGPRQELPLFQLVIGRPVSPPGDASSEAAMRPTRHTANLDTPTESEMPRIGEIGHDASLRFENGPVRARTRMGREWSTSPLSSAPSIASDSTSGSD